MKVALAQTKPVTGDLEGNTQQILDYMQEAKDQGADIVLFPETAITGYCCGSLFEHKRFIEQNIDLLKERIVPASTGIAAVIGFVDYKGEDHGRLKITNSAAIMQNGNLLNVYDKILLANDGHHEDRKYFSAGIEAKVTDLDINGKTIKIGTPICEDVWHQDHDRDIVGEMVAKGAELILSPNYSYFHIGKQETRYELFSEIAKRHQVPVAMVNAVGVGDIVKDILIYDGNSLAFNDEGGLVACLEDFKTDMQTTEFTEKTISEDDFIGRRITGYEAIYDALVFEQKELFDAIGLQNAQVHVSGGLDSAIVAALVSEAMGTDHTVLISNPTEHNGEATRGYAQHIADSLGVKLYWNETQEPYKAAMESFEKAFGETPTPAEQAPLEAVMRTAQGISASHYFNTGIVSTPNHTEIVLGWATYHDIGSIGVHAPIGDLTKTELYGLAQYINFRAGKEIIPKDLYDGSFKAKAELADADEDPIDYQVMSGICAEIIRNRKDPVQLVEDYRNRTLEHFAPIDWDREIYDHVSEEEFAHQAEQAFRASQISVYKAAQGAPIVLLNERGRGFSNRETIINGWRP